MKGLTAEQIYPSVKAMILQLDNCEREKLETMILGEVESFDKRVARISAELNEDDNYKVLGKNNNRKRANKPYERVGKRKRGSKVKQNK